jgi:hypothetical protein
MNHARAQEGTTLVEAIIAVGLLAGAVVGLAALSSVAVRQVALANERTMAMVLARQKLEALCREAPALGPSAENAWSVDSPGHVEYLDAHGRPIGARRGVYVRRWAVAPLAADANLLAIQVAVAVCRPRPGAAGCGDAVSQARLAGARSRLAW